MGSVRRGIVPLRFKVLMVDSLIALRYKLTPMGESALVTSYGEILNLLTVKVNTRALVSLAQFYDSSLQCFTFRDFHLAPTIEEFERILGRYLKDFSPFTNLGEIPSLDMIVAALSLPVRDVVSCLKVKGATRGFSIKSL